MQTKDKIKYEKIINVVANMIANKGIESISINKVATKAGISKGTVYIYFKDKADLLRQTYLAKRQMYNEYFALNLKREGTCADQLESFIDCLYRFGKEHTTAMLGVDAIVSSHLRSEFFTDGREPEAMLTIWKQVIDKGIKQGIIKGVDAYSVNFVLFHTICGYIKDVYYGNLNETDLPFAKVKDILLNGLLK